jgi:hypothetical protein
MQANLLYEGVANTFGFGVSQELLSGYSDNPPSRRFVIPASTLLLRTHEIYLFARPLGNGRGREGNPRLDSAENDPNRHLLRPSQIEDIADIVGGPERA